MDSLEGYGSGTLSAFITGALVGAGVALLFASQPGSQLRGLLRDYAARVNDEVDEAIDRGNADGKSCRRLSPQVLRAIATI